MAAEVGLNLKSLRYYFERREDLVAAAFMRSISLHRALIAAATGSASSAEARVRLFARRYFEVHADVAQGRRPHFVYFGDLRAFTPPLSRSILDAYIEMFREARAMLDEPDRPIEHAARNARTHLVISQLLWSVVWLNGYLPEDYGRASERFADILFGGIAARSADLPEEETARDELASGTSRLSQDSFLRAATASINANGYRGAAVDRISSALNVTKGAFYHHNDNRDGLVIACFERDLELIRAVQNAAIKEQKDGLSRVGASAAALITRQMAADGVMLRTSALTSIGPETRQEIGTRIEIHTARFADMLSDGVADGSVRPCNVRIASEMIFAAINATEEIGHWVPTINRSNIVRLYLEPLIYGLHHLHPG